MLTSHRALLLAGCLTCYAGAPLAATVHGTVVRVVDGDTLTIADGRHRKFRVRLSGIDAPEKQQAFGRQAAANLATLILGRSVVVEWDKRDAYGRVIGKVRGAPSSCAGCGRTEDVGLAQITAGYAWWYRSESRELSNEDKSRYAFAENAAHARHLGLWRESQPVPPWQWRHGRSGHSSYLLARTGTRIKRIGTVIWHPVRSVRRTLTTSAAS